ncbi:MAG: hypothetical protein ABI051_17165 [Vicinamibacterales bacterium]
MHLSTRPSSWRHSPTLSLLVLSVALVWPTAARAQYGTPSGESSAIGEKYHAEISGSFWSADPAGLISSEQFGLLGSKIDFLTDLNFTRTRFKDMRIVLRPSKKAKFRIQYTPVEYQSEVLFKRSIVFNGIVFPVSVPVESTFGWKVWRFGYEYDFLYKSRGFVGMLLDARYTTMDASLKTNSPLLNPQLTEFVKRKAPLPAIGVVARGYVLPRVAVDFEVSGLKLPDVDPKYQANYYDWDLHGTVNLSNNFGVQVGWRRMTTFLSIENDTGDVKFQGMWFGAALRY